MTTTGNGTGQAMITYPDIQNNSASIRLLARPSFAHIGSLEKAATMNPTAISSVRYEPKQAWMDYTPALDIQIVETTAYPMPYQSSIYGISAPGAESFIPLAKYSRHAAKNRHRFILGYQNVGTKSTSLCPCGVDGWLCSSSPGVLDTDSPSKLGGTESLGLYAVSGC